MPRFFFRNLARLLPLAAMVIPSSLLAHEYWLEPRQYTIEVGERLEGDLKNGQHFKGSNYSYIEKNIDFFRLSGPEESIEITGRNGDVPAMSVMAKSEGLYVASYQGKFDRILFTNEDKIKQYAEYEGLEGLLKRHRERGFEADSLQEQYARCAKALFQVGSGTNGNDQLTGLKLELVAEINPYSLGEGDALPVRLYWEGDPMPDTQIRLFRFDGELTTLTARTDAEGRATFLLAGGGKFMMNAVYIFEGDDDPDTRLAQWVSYWATLTFGLADSDEHLAKLKAN